jgi:glycosyltransferase involved in cell wall biosynthesis
MGRKYNIAYLTTYLDDRLSKAFSLPYSIAGQKKKDGMIEILKDHCVTIFFVSMFSRVPGKLFSRSLYRKNRNTIIIPGFFTIPIINYLFNPLSTTCSLVNAHKKRPIDIIIMYNCTYESAIPSFFMHLIFRVKIVCQYEDGWIFTQKGLKRFIYIVSHFIAQKISNGVIINTINFLDIFPKKNFLIFRGSINAIEIPKKTKDIRKRRIKILFSSTLDHIRGADLLIDFFLNTEDETITSQASFLITGTGDPLLADELMRAIDCYNMKGGEAVFCGLLNDEEMLNILNTSDIMLALQNPDYVFSKYCFPSKIFDYYSCNKPIISTKISDLQESEFTNLSFIDYTSESLAMKIKQLIANLSHYLSLNKHNSERLFEMHSVNKNISKVNDFLEKISDKAT